MDSRLIQAVVRIWGLCKLSVFLIVMENSPRLSKQFLEFCACSICLAQLDCKFSSIIGIADCGCGILIWCKLGLFLFDSHCYDRSALPVFICWWDIHSCKSMLWARENSLDHLNITYQPRSWKWRTNCFLFFCFVYIVVKNISSLPNQMLKFEWPARFSHIC